MVVLECTFKMVVKVCPGGVDFVERVDITEICATGPLVH